MDSSLRKWFHAAAVTAGGERSCISAAVSLSMTFIGPPHSGQRQRSAEPLAEEASGWAGGFCGAPGNGKDSGRSAADVRLVQKTNGSRLSQTHGKRCTTKR